MNITRWIMRSKEIDQAKLKHYNDSYGLEGLVAKVLAARNYSDARLESLFGTKKLEDPFSLKDMKKAADYIQRAIDSGEKIAIYGDYDCDGVCSTTILYTYLLSVGASVCAYIPERSEGYGLSKNGIDSLKKQDVDLIITVDNGIVAIEEADYIYECGMSLVITDHHKPGDTTPKAEAIVNPHQKDCESSFKDLCGAGVAFKLIAALEGGDYDNVFDFAGDLTAIATIGDVMPLVGENRIIVEKGLRLINVTENLGLNALINLANIGNAPSAGSVSFGICPRINAAGRFGCACDAFKLLTCEDAEEAKALAIKVCEYNSKRKDLEQEILKQIEDMLSKNEVFLYSRIMVLAGKGWSHGVLGIIAGKLCEKYSKPVVLLSIEDGIAQGSARSIKGFSIHKAMEFCKDLFTKWGGHELAGGMTMPKENVEKFREKINEYASENKPPHLQTEIDLAITNQDITVGSIKSLKLLAPFGMGNPQPIFVIKNARLEETVPLSGGKFLRFKFIVDNNFVSAICFNKSIEGFYYKKGDVFNLLVSLDINKFQGEEKADIRIIDMRPTDVKQMKIINGMDDFSTIMRKENIPKAMLKLILPNRNEFAAVYKLLSQMKRFKGDPQDLYLLIFKSGISFSKLCVILNALKSADLIDICSEEIVVKENPSKVDLNETEIIKYISQKLKS